MDRVAPVYKDAGVIEQDARVVAVADGLAWVEARRASACGSCSSATGCGTSVLAKLFGGGATRFEVTDPIGVEVGEPVVIGIAGTALIRASLLAYLLPLITLMLAALAAGRAGAGEGLCALSGLAGLALGLWGSGRLARRNEAGGRYRPVLLRRALGAIVAVGGPRVPDAGPIGRDT